LIWRLCLGLVLLFQCISPSAAHQTPNTIIELDVGVDGSDLRITIPLGEIGYAYGTKELSLGELQKHFHIRSSNGTPWTISAARLSSDALQSQPDMIATFRITPPPGSSGRKFSLSYDGVIDRVASHVVLVLARTDFAGGVLDGKPKMLGALQGSRRELAIDLGHASRWLGFFASLRLGIHHMSEGYDHILFLIMLILPSPLLAMGGRWSEPAGRKVAFRRSILIVTAFTLGHSLTLIGGAFFGWNLPSPPVEIAIAVSIVISAVHSFRPLFPGKEPLVAGTFGLIHGLAFATIIGSFALPPVDKAMAILGFNLGIEAVQLVIVVLLLPLLLVLARRPFFAPLRNALSGMASIAALVWIAERATLF
jgi:hypothetical protein